MVSLDVISLFPRVPTDETLIMLQDKSAANPLLKKCSCIPLDVDFLCGNDLLQDGVRHKPTRTGYGILPLLPVLANEYMKYLEEMILQPISLKSSF